MRAIFLISMLLVTGLVVPHALGQGFNQERDYSRVVDPDEVDPEELSYILLNLDMHRDLLYAHDRNPLHRLHLLLPRKKSVEGPLPLVVWIHGGAWMGGDKSIGLDRLTPLVRSGRYAAASIGYRFSAEARWPAQAHDCKAAIRWLRAHAEEFGYDPDRIAVMGASAGGHLAAILGTSAGESELEGKLGRYIDQPTDVACVVDLWGPTDFLQMDANRPQGATLEHAAPGSPEVRLVGGSFDQKMDLVRSANPITHIDDSNPPFLIIHGTKDMSVPFHQSTLLKEALDANGDEAVLVTVKEGGHELKLPEVDKIILAFLENVLHGSGDSLADRTVSLEGRRPSRAQRIASGERPARGERSRTTQSDDSEKKERSGRARPGGEAGDGRASRTEQMFRRSDRDGDGRVTVREVPRGQDFGRRFEFYDTDGDGSLDLEEFTEMLNKAGGSEAGGETGSETGNEGGKRGGRNTGGGGERPGRGTRGPG